MNILTFYRRILFIFFLVLQNFNFSNGDFSAHNDCFFILGNFANNVYKESLVKRILKAELSELEEKVTFRMLTNDVEKWKLLLTSEDQVLVNVQHHDNPLTIIIVYEGTDEMNLKEITLLSQMIQYAKHFALTEIGKTTPIQTMTLLLNSAHCTHTGQLQIDSPNKVFFCNDIKIDQLPLVEPESIVQDFEDSAHRARRHKTLINVKHSFHHRDMHYTIQEDTRDGAGKHKRKRPTKQRIEEMKTLAKRARRKHHSPEKIMVLPIAQRKLMCKYRKSCYETGVIPDGRHVVKDVKIEEKHSEEAGHEISDAELKLVCKYRKSCYAHFGTDEGKKVKPKKHRVLTARARVIAEPKKKKSLKEIANKALEQVKKQEQKRHELPKPKKAIVERKLNETEANKLKLSCRYRKSCYATGKIPTLVSKYEFLMKFLQIIPDTRKEKQKNFTDLEEMEKKTFCHYRKSCYTSGLRPTLKNATELKIKHVIKKKEEEIPLQLRCKYRKSCYETKVRPTIMPVEVKVLEEETKPPPIIVTLKQLKTHCKYRKSCYQKKLNEHEREEFLMNMQRESQATEDNVDDKTSKEQNVKENKTQEAVFETPGVTTLQSEKDKSTTKKISEPESTEKAFPKKKETRLKKDKDVKGILKSFKNKEAIYETKGEETKKTEPVVSDSIKETEMKMTKNLKGNMTTSLEKKKEKAYEEPPQAEQTGTQKGRVKKGHMDKRNKTTSKTIKERPTKGEKGQKKETEKTSEAKVSISTKGKGIKEKDRLSCKYRKSCYGRGKRYEVIKDIISTSVVERKAIELRCKYRKSCYETGKTPESKPKLFTAMEDIVKKLYDEVEHEKQFTRANNKKLYCKYRKSCYSNGKLPILKKDGFKTLADTNADATQSQLRCEENRKSCYKKSNILLDRKIEKLKKTVRREDAVSDTTIPKDTVQTKMKTTEDKRKGGSEKRLKKDNEEKNEEEEGEKNEKKAKVQNKTDEEDYKQIKFIEPKLEEKHELSLKEKLSCKYRKRCYEGHEIIKFKHHKLEAITMKGLKRPNGQPCSIYYISCRKMVGLPIRQRPPIGPSGKRLCRKKLKNAIAFI